MLNDFIYMVLGSIHQFVSEQYIPIVDAVVAPVVAVVIVIFCCIISAIAVRSILRAIWSGV